MRLRIINKHIFVWGCERSPVLEWVGLPRALPSSSEQLSTHSMMGLPCLWRCPVAAAMPRAWLSCSYLFCLAAQGLSRTLSSEEYRRPSCSPSCFQFTRSRITANTSHRSFSAVSEMIIIKQEQSLSVLRAALKRMGEHEVDRPILVQETSHSLTRKCVCL